MEALDIDYFIDALSTVPDKDWTLSTDPEANDAWEWLGHAEGRELIPMISRYGLLIEVNDGTGLWSAFGPTPKTRVMRFLYQVKKALGK